MTASASGWALAPRIVVAHLGYGLVLCAALAGVGLLRMLFDTPAFRDADFLAFVVAAALAAFACRRWKTLHSAGAAGVVLSLGLAGSAFTVYAVRGISLPTPSPYSWAEAAGLVFTLTYVAKLLASASIAGVLLAWMRRTSAG